MYRILFVFMATIVALASSHGATAQPNPALERMQDQIYRSFVFGNIPLWERTLEEMERYEKGKNDPAILYDLLLARYGYVAFSLENDPDKAKNQLDKAEKDLERLFKYQAYQSNAWALQGAFLGFRISLRPFAAVSLGPRSYKAINSAVESGPNNPVAWMEMANSRFYTPSTFGGSKQEALEYYQKAVRLFEADLRPNQRWLYLNCLVGMAKSYEFLDQKQKAIDTYKKALTYEPGFKWVRDDLLPAISK